MGLNKFSSQQKSISEIHFSSRELDVLACLLSRKPSKKIAELLNIQAKTVDTHILRIREKLECSSREGVVELAEGSSIAQELQTRYLGFIIQAELRKKLYYIASLIRGNKPNFLLVDMFEKGHEKAFISQIENDIQHAGFVVVKGREEDTTHGVDFLIYCADSWKIFDTIPKDFLDDMKLKHKSVFFMAQEPLKGIDSHITEHTCIDIGNRYALGILELFMHVLPELPIKPLWEKLNTQLSARLHTKTQDIIDSFNYQEESGESKTQQVLYPKSYFLSIMFVSVCAFLIIVDFSWWHKTVIQTVDTKNTIPNINQADLRRENLLQKIEEKIKGRGIRAVALVGTEGSGKTVLARQHALKQGNIFIWELNAQTEDSLFASFEHLADVLCKEFLEKKNLETIRKNNVKKNYKQKLLSLVQKKLKAENHWCLIFDHVDNYQDIESFLPQDENIWGEGQLIMTMRDAPPSNLYPVIQVTPIQITLANNETPIQNEKTELLNDKFLKKMYSFSANNYAPTIAIIKNIIDTYPECIELLLLISLLHTHDIPFELLTMLTNTTIAENFIKYMNKHSLITFRTSSDKTSLSINSGIQNIIVQHLSNVLHKNDKEKYINNILEVLEKFSDKIIYEGDLPSIEILLKGLLDFSKHTHFLSQLNLGLLYTHIGRLGHHVGRVVAFKSYTIKGLSILNSLFNKQDHHGIARALAYLGAAEKMDGDYITSKQILEKSARMYESSYSNRTLERAYVLLLLGNLYLYTGEFDKSISILQESKKVHEKNKSIQNLLIANGCLADVYLLLGNYKQALTMYQQNLSFNKQKFKKSYNQISWGRARIGLSYIGLGKYLEAEKFLKEALQLYQELLPENYEMIQTVLLHLGNVKKLLGLYNESKKFIEESNRIEAKYCRKNNRNKFLSKLYNGQLLLDMGQYEKAKDILEKCLIILEKHPKNNHPNIGCVMHSLANVYTKLGNYKKAKRFFKQSMSIFTQHYGQHHTNYALVLYDFACLALYKKDYDEAEEIANRAFHILKANGHDDFYKCIETLGDICFARIKVKSNMQKIKENKYQANLYFQKALDIAESLFPKDSMHIVRIQEKLKKTIE